MAVTAADVATLYKGRQGVVDIVDVPELLVVSVAGHGDPAGEEFAAAVQALYTVSYGAHFAVKKLGGDAPRVLPLEALWWMDDPAQQDIVAAVAFGHTTMADTDRDRWCWKALMVQLPPIDETVLTTAVDQARGKNLPALDRLALQRWEEGRCAQTLHVGPYADEAPSIVGLHEAIAANGYRPRGRHHEIYLGDPRRAAPQKLRTLLRHPIAPAA